MQASKNASAAPRILSDACLLFDDLIDQLIDGGNTVAQRNATKHYWERPSEQQKSIRSSDATEYALIRGLSRSSLGSGGDGDAATEGGSTKTSSSGGVSQSESRFVFALDDFLSTRPSSESRFVFALDDFLSSRPSKSSATTTPMKDTYRTLCSRIEDGGSASERQESLYRSTSQENASALAQNLGYKMPPPSSNTTATTSATPDYRAEPIWREKKRELMRALKHRH
uniref:CUE domain-containing protein n=1 Tax=Steinernema glaseri TaxID=37863 RepID=A0A1I7XZX1_9BILA